MKNLIKIIFLCGILIITSFSCDEDDISESSLFYELKINGDSKIINIEKNKIEFKFCLLNGNGEAATEFNEGDNFKFYFSIANKNDFDIIINADFINENFFRIYKNEEDNIVDLGKPWTSVFCEYSLQPQEFKLSSNDTLSFKIPWVVDTEENNIDYYPFCFAKKKDFIITGQYYTHLNFDLHYSSIYDEYEIKDVLFKINFKIK